MWRTIGGAAAGYIFMAIFLSVTFGLLWVVLGREFAFRPGSLEVTVGWILVSLPLSLVAAVFGGWMAAHVGRSERAVKALAGLVLVLGFLSAALQINKPGLSADEQAAVLEKVEQGEMGNLAVGQYARQPAWFALLLPLVGAGGVFVGGNLRLKDGF